MYLALHIRGAWYMFIDVYTTELISFSYTIADKMKRKCTV